MANFWAGVGQGFSGGFKRAWDASARRREREEDREQALEDRRAAWDREDAKRKEDRAQALADAEDRRRIAIELADRARQNKLTDLKMQLEREAIKERQGQEAILESLSPEAREKALGDRLLFTGLQPETPAMLKGLDMGEVGRLDKYDTMTPSELQGTGLAGQRIEKELLAERVAEKAAKRAIDLEKSKLGLTTGAETVKAKEDLVGGILNKYGQLGDKTPTPDKDALMLMPLGKLRQLEGGLDARLAEKKRGLEEKPTARIAQHEYLQNLRNKYNEETDPAKKAKLGQEIEDFTADKWDMVTLPDGTTLSKTRSSKKGGSTGTGSGSGLSSKQKEALDASEIALAEAASLLQDFGSDASKNLNIWNRAAHKIKNIALPAAGVDSWADPEMASYRARAEKLSGQALAAMHKMHGGGMMSAADVVLYGKGIPNTDTYSPVAYNAKFKAWQQSMEGLVNYYRAKETMADLPAHLSDLDPELAFKIAGQKDPKTNQIILDNNTLKFLMGNSPSFKATYEEVMSLVRNKGITFDQGLDWIEALKIDVPNRR